MMEEAERQSVSGIANFAVMTMALLITELDRTGGQISKRDFRKLLTEGADSSEKSHDGTTPRIDIILLRNLVSLLADDDTTGPAAKWTPVVIPGGFEA